MLNLTDGSVQRLCKVAEDDVPGRVPVTIVDELEWYSTSARMSATGPSETLRSRELGCEGEDIGLTPVREPREAVHQRLPLDHLVEPCILERHNCLPGERRGNHPLLDVEFFADEKETPASQSGLELEVQAGAPDTDVAGLDERAILGDDDAPVGVRGLDGPFDDHATELLGVERCGERVPKAGVGFPQPPALLLELVHTCLELGGHLVECPAEGRELVASLDRHPLTQSTGRDGVRAFCEARERADDRPAGDVRNDRNQEQRADQAEQQGARSGLASRTRSPTTG